MSRFFQPVCLNILSSLGGFAATLPEGESKNYRLIASLPPFNGGRLFILFYALGSTQEYRRLL